MSEAKIGKSAEQMMQAAREVAGIEIVDGSIAEALTRLLAALDDEAELNMMGAAAMEQRIMRLLVNRLRMLRDFEAHPEIGEQAIVSPVILTGGPRTGSTKLHKLLAASGDFKHLLFWQGHCPALINGVRGEDPAARIAEAEDYAKWIADNAPVAQESHGYGTFEPEEEALLLEHFVCSTFTNVFAHVPSFMEWRATQNFTDELSFLKQALQYIQWQFHDGDPRRWLLKCPIYWGTEDALAAVFPDAVFIATHRDPQKTVGSSVNLVQGYRQAYSDVARHKILGGVFLDGLSFAASRHMTLVAERPNLGILDIPYGELTQSVGCVIDAVYRHCGMTLSSAARASMIAWDDQHRYEGRPKPYDLADFGLTREGISSAFADYSERYGRYF